jgi:hypothetical protein
MFNLPVNQNNILNNNNNNLGIENNLNYNNNNMFLNNNNLNMNNYQFKIEDPVEENQRKTLEEFKLLLQKMDEKIDS